MQKRGKNPATPSVKVHTAPAQKLLVRQELLHKAVAKTGVSRRKSGNRQTVPRIRLRRILELLHKAVDKIGATRRKNSHVDRAK